MLLEWDMPHATYRPTAGLPESLAPLPTHRGRRAPAWAKLQPTTLRTG